ncbi:hypothetical protein [Micromonospora zhanjiangensis]
MLSARRIVFGRWPDGSGRCPVCRVSGCEALTHTLRYLDLVQDTMLPTLLERLGEQRVEFVRIQCCWNDTRCAQTTVFVESTPLRGAFGLGAGDPAGIGSAETHSTRAAGSRHALAIGPVLAAAPRVWAAHELIALADVETDLATAGITVTRLR